MIGLNKLPPRVTGDMLDARFWLQRAPAPDAPWLSAEAIAAFNARVSAVLGIPPVLDLPDELDGALVCQALESYRPLPATGTATTRTRIAEVQDKGSAAVIIQESTTVDDAVAADPSTLVAAEGDSSVRRRDEPMIDEIHAEHAMRVAAHGILGNA